jgi:di/tricarboxylate transporter
VNDALLTTLILAATIALFVSDRLRLDVVAMISLLALALTGLASTEVVLSGFSNPAVLMIAGLFVVGAAITETGVADWFGRRLEKLAGKDERRVLVVIVSATALLSAFMSSTGTVALLLPVVGSIAARRGIAPGRLLMPLAFGAHLGSNLTLISTPPNLIVSDALRGAGHEPFRFFGFLGPGLVIFAVGVAYLTLYGRRLLPAGDALRATRTTFSDRDLAAEYGLADALSCLRVPEQSTLVGRSLAETNLRAVHGVTVVGVVRSGEALRVLPRLVFEAGDELRVLGGTEALASLAAEHGTELLETASHFSLPVEESLAEIVLPRRSRLVGRALRDAKFRDRYRATVLALHRIEGTGRVCLTDASLRDVALRPGDILLVKGRRKYLRNLRDERDDLVLVAEPDVAADVLVDRPRAFGSVAITLAMLVVMAFGWLPNVVAVLGAALLLVITGCLRPTEVYRSVNWESVVLIACMIPLSTTLEASGATSFVVSLVETNLGGASPLVLMALVTCVTSALGLVLSNTATAVLVAPVAVRLASAFGIAPEPLLMGVAFGASAAFATPIASPVNVLVMTPGGYRFADYTRIGLPLQLLVLASAVLVIPLFWPF